MWGDKYHGGVPTDHLPPWQRHDGGSPPDGHRAFAWARFCRWSCERLADLSHRGLAGLITVLVVGSFVGYATGPTTWLVRKTGANTNGGTSASVLATATDGVTNASNNNLTSVTAPFTVGMVGQGIYISQGTSLRLITAYNAANSVTYSGANLGAHTGLTYNVGGAWLTVNNALVSTNSIAAGDSVYIGAGVYRETVAVAISGSSGSPISVVGDVDGAKTGDAGQVTLTAYTTNDTTAPASAVGLNLGTHSYLSFALLTFIGGTYSTTGYLTVNSAGGVGYTFTDCTFNALANTGNAALAFFSPTTGVALSATLDRCLLVGSDTFIEFSLATTNSGSADYDAQCVVRNCGLIGNYGTASVGMVGVTSSASNTYKGGGVRVYDCTILGANTGMYVYGANNSTTVPCEIHGSTIFAIAGLRASTSGQLTESYNDIYAGTARTNVTAGTGSQASGAYAPLVELGQFAKWSGSGGTVFGLTRPFLAPDTGSPLLGFGSGGSGGNYPTVDWANRPRPSGGASVSNAVGYLERHDFAVQDTTQYPSGQTSSGKLVGPGDQFIQVPVDATTTTIAIQVMMESAGQGTAYGGTNYATATLLANGELGVASQTQMCSSTLGSWQTLTFSAITASKQGWVTIQVTSYDTGGTANTWFGALT